MEAIWAACIVCRNSTTPVSDAVDAFSVFSEVAAKAAGTNSNSSGTSENNDLILLLKPGLD